mmetsp:Transcript_29542/g.63959  ORF Transcript_29542/g.63959 Transcript_29542/m.63959 type:complete len:108 (+) Transcript_29542:354-677(+)
MGSEHASCNTAACGVRQRPAQPSTPRYYMKSPDQELEPGNGREKEATVEDEDEDDNFVTFIASEFSGLSDSSRRPRLRPAVAAVAAAAAAASASAGATPQVVGSAVA